MGFFDFLFGKKKSGGATHDASLPKINVQKRFELLNRTGQGSMSKVWRARDKSLGRVVCLKLLDKVKTEAFEARFLGLNKPREGTICLALKHKNIVQTYEFGRTTEGEYYLVMELVEGMGLNFLVETKSDKLDGHRVEYLTQVTEAIEYLHKTGYIHRDLCPRNVMVSNTGQVKLIDFGLAIPNTPAFCKPGNRTGTPNYLAPEVIRRVSTDPRVDLFALGVTAYEVFCHTLPWEKAASLQTLLSHMNSPGKSPLEHRPDLDKETVKFLVKAIEREPAKRFQTATEFKEALAALPKKW
ncbi:MAG: serine/threonine protein kinase [Gemmataceae bacterium]|nr:serine/threonine protein kinase [Gemmataceae bacterium]